jgi:hypothetical protein
LFNKKKTEKDIEVVLGVERGETKRDRDKREKEGDKREGERGRGMGYQMGTL